jgi:hypothetical protein
MALPEVIPLFPLPNVVFFPRMALPLHVFEPRYRAMVRDATRGSRLIGMVLLRAGWEQDYEGRPPIFAVGTAGELVHMDELPDGRFNVVLRGLRAFTIQGELDRAAYREAAVAWLERPSDRLPAGTRTAILELVRRYMARAGRALGPDTLEEPALDDEQLVNFFAQHLDLPVVEKQALLEGVTLGERARRLQDVLSFQLEELRANPGRPPRHAH